MKQLIPILLLIMLGCTKKNSDPSPKGMQLNNPYTITDKDTGFVITPYPFEITEYLGKPYYDSFQVGTFYQNIPGYRDDYNWDTTFYSDGADSIIIKGVYGDLKKHTAHLENFTVNYSDRGVNKTIRSNIDSVYLKNPYAPYNSYWAYGYIAKIYFYQ